MVLTAIGMTGKQPPTNESHFYDQVQYAHLALGEEISVKKTVYLDLKYWILLREAAEGHPKGESDTTMLALLRENVKSGKDENQKMIS